MAVKLKNWLPHVIFAAFSTAVLIAMFLCTDMRYDKGEEFLDEFIKKKELDKAVSEGWYCYRGPYGDSGSVMYWALNEYGRNGVHFLLRQLESGDDARIAVALDELRFALQAGGPAFGEPIDTRIEEGKKNARKIILGWKNEMLRLAVSENPVVREHAVRLLAETIDMDIVPGLKEIGDSTRSAQVRANAIGGLSMLQWECKHSAYRDIALAEQIQGWLEEYLTDSEALVRVAAVSVLDTDENAKLIKKMQQDSDIRVRVCAARKLFLRNMKYDRQVLLSGVCSPLIEKYTRLEIAQKLAWKCDKRALPVLIELIDDPDITKLWGMDVVSHYGDVSMAISQITGEDYGWPWQDETFEAFSEKVKAKAMAWWQKHKDEVLKGRK